MFYLNPRKSFKVEKIKFFSYLLLVLILFYSTKSFAQEMLLNGSFELPVVSNNGNNLGVTVPNWNHNYEANIVKPYSGYLPLGPNATPTGGGNQYYDSNSINAVDNVRQSFTLSQNGMIDFSAYFSVRDSQQAVTGTINIINSSGATVGSVSTSFLASEPMGLWKQAISVKLPLAAGTYTFSVVLPDTLNIDMASVFFYPAMSISKTVAIFSDNVNGTNNPHAIPDAFVDYTITVKNNASYTVTNNSIVVSDTTPANLSMFVGNLSATSGPVAFTNGTPSSALTYTSTSLSSLTDNLDFSNNNGSTWTYVPNPNIHGVDSSVTNFRIKPSGSMAPNSYFSFKVRYQIK